MAEMRKPEKSEGYYSADAAAARRAAEQERAAMSQDDAQAALGRPGEPINPEPGLTHDQVEQWGTQAEKDEFAKQAAAREEAIRRTPSMGGDDNDKGLGSRLRGVLAKRRKMIIAAALSSSLVGVIIAGFFALLPLKLESFMKNFGQQFGDKVENATEKRVGQIVTYYLVKRALGAEFANCDNLGDGAKACDPIINKGGILGDTYRNMQIKKFENTLAEKHNIRFRSYVREDGKRMLMVITPAETFEDTLDRYQPDRDLFANHKEARLKIKQAVRQEIPSYKIMKRRHMRALLRDKYGVKQWRMFEKTRDKVDDKARDAKNKFRALRIENVTKPVAGKMGIYLKCVVEGCAKSELNSDADPTKIEEANQTAANSDCSGPATSRPTGCQGGLNNDSEGDRRDGEGNSERAKARQNAIDSAGNMTEDIDIGDIDPNASPEEVRKIIQKATVKKLVGIGITGIGIAEVISQIDKAISEDYISDIQESRNKLQFVRAYQVYQTSADEWKNGEMSGEQVNALMSSLDGAETSRLYAADNNLTIPTSKKTCNDGKVLPPAELVCEDRMIRPKEISDTTAYYNSSPALKVMHSIAVTYRATIGKFFGWAGDIVSSLTGPIFEAAMNAMPDQAKEVVQSMIDWVLNKFFGIVVTGAETGGDLYEIIRGGAKSMYNDVAQFTIGGTTLTPEQITILDQEIAEEKDLENSSLGSKIANLDYDKSLASRALAAMPFSFEGAVSNTMTAAINPTTWFSGFRGLSRASIAAQGDAQGIKEKGWPPDPESQKWLLLSPADDFWDHCEEFNAEWSKQIAEDPDRVTEVRTYRGEIVRGVNPCRIDFVALETTKSIFTDEDDGGINVNSETANSNDEVEKGPVVLIGDSIMKGADDIGNIGDLLSDAGWPATVDGVVNRTIGGGAAAIQAQKNEIKDAKVVVMELGTNPGGSINLDNLKNDVEARMDEIDAINSGATVMWANIISESSNQYDERNQKIKEAVEDKGGLVINMKSKNIELASDKLHPTSAGYDDYAKGLYSEIIKSASSGESSGKLAWPLPSQYGLSSCWNTFRSYYNGGAGGGHSGLDITAPEGVPIKAADGGKVVLAADRGNSGYGKVVIIKHSDNLFTLYAHLSSIDVKQGKEVGKGATIGKVGNTGASRGAHLHFNVQTRGVELGLADQTKNPLDYLPKDPKRALNGCVAGSSGHN